MADKMLRFSGDLTIATIEDQRRRLLEAFDDGGNLVLDTTAALDLDASFVQLVLSARLGAKSRGMQVLVPPELNKALLALADEIGLPPDALS